MASEASGEFAVVICTDPVIQKLNHDFRGKDKPTDVLSFLTGDTAYLGDIIISLDTAEKQAKAYQCTLLDELTRLTVHGLLHLLGYEHEKVNQTTARRMRRREEQLWRELIG